MVSGTSADIIWEWRRLRDVWTGSRAGRNL